MLKASAKHGFTLIELSVVLVIIGLLFGAVLAGREMVRQSQVNSVSVDVQTYKAATIQFKQKYGYLPGDFPNASTYWGTPSGGCPKVDADTSGPTTACGGNGDGKICNGSSGNGLVLGTSACMESLYAWQHLALAKFISGMYWGAMLANGAHELPGYNIPASKITGAGYDMYFLGNNPDWLSTGSHIFFPGNYGHVITFGMQAPNSNADYTNLTLYPALSVTEALSLDTKSDDGMPATGLIMSESEFSAFTPGCTTSESINATYNVIQPGKKCALIFLMQDF